MQTKFMLALLGIVLLASLSFFGCTAQPENTGITAKAAGGGIDVSWNPSQKANIAGYNLYRSTSSGTTGSKISPVMLTTTTYADTSVTHGTTYYYTVRSVTSGGTEDTNTQQASAASDLSPPTDLQIQINGGAQYANSKSVTLSLSATNADQCRLSNDATSWSVWQPYSISAAWQLSDGDGPKTVYYECKDSAGNSEHPATASIYLDMNGPSVSISSPQSGTSYGSPVQLSFTVADSIATTVTCTGTLDNGAIAIGKVDTGKLDTMSITVQPGQHTIAVSCNDGANTATQSVSFTVASDQPSVYMHIESGAGYVSTTRVTLDITATNADQCRFANENMAWNSWAYYTTSVGWTLSAGDGLKTVHAQCKSASGQMSATVSDTVNLYTTPASYISVEIDNGDDWTNTRDVRLGLYCYSAYQCRYRNENGDWSGYGSYTTGKSWTLSSGEGDKKVYYNCIDANGRDLGTASAAIYYSEKQRNAPTSVSVKINGGSTETTSTDVSLTLRATNADACRVSNEVGSWTSWQSYKTSMSWTLTSGAGRKTVYYECRNDYGTTDASASIYLDNSPPGPINNLRATVDKHGDVHLSWSRPSGDVYRYYVYRSNTAFGMFTKVGTTSTTSYADYGLVADSTYAYYVTAVDSAGNEGPNSNTVEAHVPGGTIEPGGDTDSHGCKSSAGYTWCEPLQECIKSWETECSSRTPEPSVGGDTDSHGCKTSAGYSWCESSGKCIRAWEEEFSPSGDFGGDAVTFP